MGIRSNVRVLIVPEKPGGRGRPQLAKVCPPPRLLTPLFSICATIRLIVLLECVKRVKALIIIQLRDG